MAKNSDVTENVTHVTGWGKTAKSYVEDLLAKRKEEQKYIAYRLYLEGWTQEEIGERIGASKDNVYRRYFCCKNGKSENLPVLQQKSLTDLDIDSEFGKLETQVKEEQKYIAYRLYLEGWTQEEIGERIGMTKQGVNKAFCQPNGKNENLPIGGQNSLTDLPLNSEFGKLETQVKEALDSGIPHLDCCFNGIRNQRW